MNSKCKIQKIILSFSTIGTAVSGEHLTVHVYANSDSEKLLVGRLDLVGQTQSTFKKSLTIVYPEGYGLTANLVDSYGLPFNDGREVVISIDADKSDTSNSEKVGELSLHLSLDTTQAQNALDELDKRIRNSEAFKVLNGEVFIHNAFIGNSIQTAALETPQTVTNTYNVSIGLDVATNVEAILENALKNHRETTKKNNDDFMSAVRKIIMLECLPGGVLHRQFDR